MLFAYIHQETNIILMGISSAELGEFVNEILNGLKQVSPPSFIQKVVLEVDNLTEVGGNGNIFREIVRQLGEKIVYPVLVREKRLGMGKLVEGEYVVDVNSYSGGRFVSCGQS